MNFESKFILSMEEIREYIPYLKSRKGRYVVSVAVDSNTSCMYFFASDLANKSTGIAAQYLTGSAVPMALVISGEEEPMLVLDSFDSQDVFNAFSRYETYVVSAERGDMLGLFDEFKYYTRMAQEYQDYLADEYNIKVDARHQNVEMEWFDV